MPDRTHYILKPSPTCENEGMRRVTVYRDGNQMAAKIGPDRLKGIAGFGDTIADAIHDLAHQFGVHHYELRGNSAGIEVAGELIEVTGLPEQSSSDVLRALAKLIEERGYQESHFPEPNWEQLANEERVVSPESRNN
jgi:hypothetical protein